MVSHQDLLVSMGEPAGIGPDIILMAWKKSSELKLPNFSVIGDVAILQERAKQLNIDVAISSKRNCADLHVVPLENTMICDAGKPDGQNSAGVIEAITRGFEMVWKQQYRGLVTCPINKAVLYDAAFKFPGHTEYLAYLASRKTGQNIFPVMMLAGAGLRTVPVTIHIALEDVPKTLSRELIEKTVKITARDMAVKLGITRPTIVLAGLNPHAGENGTMGNQENEYIKACVDSLQAEGLNITGPLPADTMFHARARNGYDVAICMYHDQALIPLKTLAFDDGVNITLGLPIIRTSPDHGTAFDLAGTGKARPDSFIAALRAAKEMADNCGGNS